MSQVEHKKFSLAKNLSMKVIDEIYNKTGLNEKNIEYLYKIGDSIIQIVKKEADFLDELKAVRDFTPYAYTHPFFVCVFSMMICRKLKWDSPRTIQAVALAALIHDIGMTKLPFELRMLSPDEMTEDQLKLYKTHPEEGMKLVAEFSQIPSAVQQIIYQHHEGNSRGFPNQTSSIKIYPLARIITLADRFTRILMDNDLSPIEGIKKLLSDKMELAIHDPTMVKALIMSFIKDEKSESKEQV